MVHWPRSGPFRPPSFFSSNINCFRAMLARTGLMNLLMALPRTKPSSSMPKGSVALAPSIIQDAAKGSLHCSCSDYKRIFNVATAAPPIIYDGLRMLTAKAAMGVCSLYTSQRMLWLCLQDSEDGLVGCQRMVWVFFVALQPAASVPHPTWQRFHLYSPSLITRGGWPCLGHHSYR